MTRRQWHNFDKYIAHHPTCFLCKFFMQIVTHVSDLRRLRWDAWRTNVGIYNSYLFLSRRTHLFQHGQYYTRKLTQRYIYSRCLRLVGKKIKRMSGNSFLRIESDCCEKKTYFISFYRFIILYSESFFINIFHRLTISHTYYTVHAHKHDMFLNERICSQKHDRIPAEQSKTTHCQLPMLCLAIIIMMSSIIMIINNHDNVNLNYIQLLEISNYWVFLERGNENELYSLICHAPSISSWHMCVSFYLYYVFMLMFILLRLYLAPTFS